MLSRCWRSEAFINMLLRTQRLGSCARAGKFGTSAAIGQVLPPKAQMVAQQDWKYVSGGGRVRRASPPCFSLCKVISSPTPQTLQHGGAQCDGNLISITC